LGTYTAAAATLVAMTAAAVYLSAAVLRLCGTQAWPLVPLLIQPPLWFAALCAMARFATADSTDKSRSFAAVMCFVALAISAYLAHRAARMLESVPRDLRVPAALYLFQLAVAPLWLGLIAAGYL